MRWVPRSIRIMQLTIIAAVLAVASVLIYQILHTGSGITINFTLFDLGDPKVAIVTVVSLIGVFIGLAMIKYRAQSTKNKVLCQAKLGKWTRGRCQPIGNSKSPSQ